MKNSNKKYTYPVFESIRYQDGSYIGLEYHLMRMQRTYRRLYAAECPFDLKKILDGPADCRWVNGLYKVRFLYNRDAYEIQKEPYQRAVIRHFGLVEAGDLDYSLKYTDRSALDALKAGSEQDEIIIIRDGLVTDTSFSNLAFCRHGGWFTPKRPLLPGTARAYLLDIGILAEKDIPADEIGTYTGFKLINAMMDWKSAPVYSIQSIRK